MRLSTSRVSGANGPLLWPLALTVFGVILLLDNFLLLGDFNAMTLAPLGLVILGAQILLRGDATLSAEARRFGITRGSVESATLEVSSGEIDVEVRALQPDWRLRDGQHALIAGQFTHQARPQLTMSEQYAHLKMDRASTPWSSFADWKVGLASDLPWQIISSGHLGEFDGDFSELIIHEAVIATGFGDIRIVCPPEAFGPLNLRSTLGTIQVVTPQGYNTRIIIQAGRFFSTHFDETRYSSPDTNVYLALDADPTAPLVEIVIHGVFGDAYLS